MTIGHQDDENTYDEDHNDRNDNDEVIMAGLQQEGVCYLTVLFSKISIYTKIIFGPNLNLRYVGGSGRV